MVIAVLFFEGHLGEGAGVAIGDEDGIIAEAFGAGGCFEDMSFDDTFEEVFRVVVDEADDAAEARPPMWVVAEFLEDFCDILFAGLVFAGVAGAEDAGLATEGLYFDATVIAA